MIGCDRSRCRTIEAKNRCVSRTSRYATSHVRTLQKIQGRLRQDGLGDRATDGGLFGGQQIDAASLDELEEALYTADFGVETTAEILAEIKAAYKKDKELRGQQAAEIGAAVLKRVLAGSGGHGLPPSGSAGRSKPDR